MSVMTSSVGKVGELSLEFSQFYYDRNKIVGKVKNAVSDPTYVFLSHLTCLIIAVDISSTQHILLLPKIR